MRESNPPALPKLLPFGISGPTDFHTLRKRNKGQIKFKHKKEVLPGLEPGLPDSKSDVLTNCTTEPLVTVGFEPTKRIAPDLKSGPFDQARERYLKVINLL